MPRRHDRDTHDIMRQISRDLRAASDESLNHEPTSFQRRAQVLRDLSGLCRKGLLRMAIAALENGVDRRLFARMRQSTAVQNILETSRACSPEEREQLALLILNELGFQDPNPVEQERMAARLSPRIPSDDLLVAASEDRSLSPSASRGRAGNRSRPEDSEGSEPVRRGAVGEDDHRDGGVKRPRSPTRPPGARRPLPPPPAAPIAKRPRVVFSWDLPWADLVKASSEFKNKESWITCRACLEWFRRPSAFKQHLLMKVGVGQHPTSSATGRWDFNEGGTSMRCGMESMRST